MKRHRKLGPLKRHIGFTLIELLIVMTATSAMLALLTVWIHQSLKQASYFRNVQRDQMTLTRLADDVRRTAWRSKSARLTSPVLMDFVLSDGNEVRYQVESQSIQRIERNAKQQPVATDRFQFATTHHVIWDLNRQKGVGLGSISLQVHRLPTDAVVKPASSNAKSTEHGVALSQTASVGRWAASSIASDPKEKP